MVKRLDHRRECRTAFIGGEKHVQTAAVLEPTDHPPCIYILSTNTS